MRVSGATGAWMLVMSACNAPAADSVAALGPRDPAPLAVAGAPHADVDDAASEPLAPLPPLPAALDKHDPRVQLGRRLFFSDALGSSHPQNGGPRCATCHPVGDNASGTSGESYKVRMGKSEPPVLRKINCPTVFNAAFNFRHTWDGKDPALEDVVTRPIRAKSLMGGAGGDKNMQGVLARLRDDDADVWQDAFEAAQLEIDEAGLSVALASYLRAIAPRDAPFDRWLRHDRNAISQQAEDGYALFKKLGCASCHQGRGVGGSMFARFGELVPRDQCTTCKKWLPASTTKGETNGAWVDPAQCPQAGAAGPQCSTWNENFANDGLMTWSAGDANQHIFKVPSLRNLKGTEPFFHDGSAADLDDAIRTMAKLQLDRTLKDDEVARLKAFLESLSGVVDAELVADPFATESGAASSPYGANGQAAPWSGP